MKTAEEKAHSLINSFYQPITINLNQVGAHNNSKQMWAHAAKCAAICQNEVISVLENVYQNLSHNLYSKQLLKEEITKEQSVLTAINQTK